MQVIIIGAGPAGTSCAIQLLKAGINVTLIDRNSFPRHAPGETLHPGIEPLLKQLDVLEEVQKENYIRHKGVMSEYQGEKIFERYNEVENWLGFQLFRESFDKILLRKAVSLGAKFLIGGITNVNINDKGITSITTNEGEIKADYFIDATGKSSYLNRKLKIGYKYSSPELIAYYGYVANKSSSNQSFDNPIMIWDSKGWTWISKVREDLITWNRLIFLNEKPPPTWLPEELKGYNIVRTRRATAVTWRIANHVSYRNYFLIGDAAFILDPSSSQGVIKAIMSGIMAGSLIEKISSNQLREFVAHEYYNTWIKDWYQKDVGKLRLFYKEKGLNLSFGVSINSKTYENT